MTEEVPLTSKEGYIKPLPTRDRLPKRWQTTKRYYPNSSLLRENEAIETLFHNMLNIAKQLLKHDHPIAFERDYKHDNSENAFAMHAFICPTVYLYLECAPDCRYHVEFAFNNCKHAEAIRKQFANYSFKGRTHEVALTPDFNTFYAKVLQVQRPQHIYSLQA